MLTEVVNKMQTICSSIRRVNAIVDFCRVFGNLKGVEEPFLGMFVDRESLCEPDSVPSRS